MANALELMGFHLQADVKHDFGPSAPVYNINGARANERVGAPSPEEDSTVAFFLDGAGGGIIANLAARKTGQIVFTVPEKTASFQNWKAPLLFQGGNDKIGIIQDAGEFITTRLGSKNVITFGSILDPAGKPVRQDQGPVWFEPTDNDVTIPLAPYGFDPNAIQSVRIKDLTAGTVKASFILGNNTQKDAVAMIGTTPTKPKRINNTNVGLAGFFTSINKAENIAEELSLAGFSKLDADRIIKESTYFYIGKTLGDASLVASGLPFFTGNDLVKQISNPFNGTNGASGKWKNWVSGADVVAPTTLALKTGDRLNWLRAIIMNLATIYEDQAKGERKTKQYKFFPGIADPAAVRVAILGDFDALARETAVRYNTLRLNISNELIPGGVLKLEGTTFAPGGQQVIQSSRNNFAGRMASRLLQEIASELITVDASNNVTGGICKYVTDWIVLRKGKATTIGDNETLCKFYSETLSKVNTCSPQANSLLIQKGRQEPYLTMKLIVASVPAGVALGVDGWPIPSSIDIALKNAFVALTKAREITDAEYTRLLASTDIYNRFITKLPRLRVSAQVPLDPSSINDIVTEVTGDVKGDESPMTGGAYLSVEFTNMGPDITTELQKVVQLFPRINDFVQYMSGKGVVDPQFIFLSIYDVIRRRNTDRVVDPFLAQELTLEFMDFVGLFRGTPYINIPTADPNIFKEDYIYSDRKYPSSTSTLLFNAYTYYVNARNAFELTNTTQNQSDIDFQTIEAAYLNKIPTKTSRKTGKEVIRFDQFEEAPRPKNLYRGFSGGFRARRPLYSIQPGRSTRVPTRRTQRTQKSRRTRRRKSI